MAMVILTFILTFGSDLSLDFQGCPLAEQVPMAAFPKRYALDVASDY